MVVKISNWMNMVAFCKNESPTSIYTQRIHYALNSWPISMKFGQQFDRTNQFLFAQDSKYIITLK